MQEAVQPECRCGQREHATSAACHEDLYWHRGEHIHVEGASSEILPGDETQVRHNRQRFTVPELDGRAEHENDLDPEAHIRKILQDGYRHWQLEAPIGPSRELEGGHEWQVNGLE